MLPSVYVHFDRGAYFALSPVVSEPEVTISSLFLTFVSDSTPQILKRGGPQLVRLQLDFEMPVLGPRPQRWRSVSRESVGVRGDEGKPL